MWLDILVVPQGGSAPPSPSRVHNHHNHHHDDDHHDDEDNLLDPTSFSRMLNVIGRTVFVIDRHPEGGEVDALQRLWCCYEVSVMDGWYEPLV